MDSIWKTSCANSLGTSSMNTMQIEDPDAVLASRRSASQIRACKWLVAYSGSLLAGIPHGWHGRCFAASGE